MEWKKWRRLWRHTNSWAWCACEAFWAAFAADFPVRTPCGRAPSWRAPWLGRTSSRSRRVRPTRTGPTARSSRRTRASLSPSPSSRSLQPQCTPWATIRLHSFESYNKINSIFADSSITTTTTNMSPVRLRLTSGGERGCSPWWESWHRSTPSLALDRKLETTHFSCY